jgi:hypothetical protein
MCRQVSNRWRISPRYARADHRCRRIYRRVTDAAGHAQAPACRVRWKPSVARPWLPAISMDDVWHGQRPLTGLRTRHVHAARCLGERQTSSHVPALKTGDIIAVNDVNDHINLFSLGNLVMRLRKPGRQHTATTHHVHTGGLVHAHRDRCHTTGRQARTCWSFGRDGTPWLIGVPGWSFARSVKKRGTHVCDHYSIVESSTRRGYVHDPDDLAGVRAPLDVWVSGRWSGRREPLER